MEYLEDYEDDRTEEIIRYTWNTARYSKVKKSTNNVDAGTRCKSRLTTTPSSMATSMSVSIQSFRCFL